MGPSRGEVDAEQRLWERKRSGRRRRRWEEGDGGYEGLWEGGKEVLASCARLEGIEISAAMRLIKQGSETNQKRLTCSLPNMSLSASLPSDSSLSTRLSSSPTLVATNLSSTAVSRPLIA